MYGEFIMVDYDMVMFVNYISNMFFFFMGSGLGGGGGMLGGSNIMFNIMFKSGYNIMFFYSY